MYELGEVLGIHQQLDPLKEQIEFLVFCWELYLLKIEIYLSMFSSSMKHMICW
jgi:hypothetical protein